MKQFHIIGTLKRIDVVDGIEWPGIYPIDGEFIGISVNEILDSFKIDGWEWTKSPQTTVVTEAMRLEAAGEPTLFPLPPKAGIMTVDCLRIRHGVLVDKKFLDGLTAAEADELARINEALDTIEEEYYEPIMHALAKIAAGETL